ncbi:MAG: 16S rRNA (cytosine(967)-C(5))-methyltransferase RsmB [Gammaproteobacteria bacterium]|nr:MAG: 16S rRNA (cytosine(967)-C(5))-methyltransferase RsmB [Gammaproteobacteria bacterium]
MATPYGPATPWANQRASFVVTPSDPRVLATRIVLDVVQGGFLDQVLDRVRNRLREQDQHTGALVHELSYGAIRWYFALESVLKTLLQKPLKTKDLDLQILIMIGLYQLQFLDIKPHAAVNETVNACVAFNKTWARNLINACLRRFQRERDTLWPSALRQSSQSHPKWLVETLKTNWPQHWQGMLAANNQRPPMGLRVNALKTSREEYGQTLDTSGITWKPMDHTDCGIYLPSSCPVSHLPGFDLGWVSVQDEGAQRAASIISMQTGQRVLDACAAPGGKSAHLLEHYPGIVLTALEKEAVRGHLIQDNFKRLGLQANIVIGDARQPGDWWDQTPYNHIIVDAPCSATGIIRRHPDIKLHRTSRDLAQLGTIQRQILHALWPLLASGGKLLYITCSVLPEENEQQLSAFLQQHTDATEIPLSFGHRLQTGCQLLPGDGEHDGFYYALLKKS